MNDELSSGNKPFQNHLTEELIAGIENHQIIIDHPVITLINNKRAQLIQIRDGFVFDSNSGLDINIQRNRYVANELGFFADLLESAGSYSLSPTDLIAIWSQIQGMFKEQTWYIALARMISSAYVIQDLKSHSRDGFTRYYLVNHKLPETLTNNEDLLLVNNRIKELTESLKLLESYDSKFIPDDPLTGPKSLLGIICDDFANGFSTLKIRVQNCLG